MNEQDEGVALERTALAWNRTGLSFAATAAISARFVDRGLYLAAPLLLLAAVSWAHGGRRYRSSVSAASSAPVLRVVALGTGLVAVAAALIP